MREKTTRNVSISIPFGVLDDIDEKRGDIPRSAYCRRLLMKALESEVKKGGRTK